MINAFAASLIVKEGGGHQHFDDNATILIRGLIDYIMQVMPKEARHLSTLYELYLLLLIKPRKPLTTWRV